MKLNKKLVFTLLACSTFSVLAMRNGLQFLACPSCDKKFYPVNAHEIFKHRELCIENLDRLRCTLCGTPFENKWARIQHEKNCSRKLRLYIPVEEKFDGENPVIKNPNKTRKPFPHENGLPNYAFIFGADRFSKFYPKKGDPWNPHIKKGKK